MAAIGLSLNSISQNTADIFIKNARIFDGTGNPWYYGNIAIRDGKIFMVGKLYDVKATKTIDASGMVVAPGFIDVHTHIEGEEAENPTADNFILDGVTTVVTGNCGSSVSDMKKYFHRLDS